jgi:hypothetical protein
MEKVDKKLLVQKWGIKSGYFEAFCDYKIARIKN